MRERDAANGGAPKAKPDDYKMKLQLPDLSGIMTPVTRKRIPSERLASSR